MKTPQGLTRSDYAIEALKILQKMQLDSKDTIQIHQFNFENGISTDTNLLEKDSKASKVFVALTLSVSVVVPMK